MHTRKLALLAALALAGGAAVGFTPEASAAGYVSISVGTPPPPLRYEVVPAPRPGYVWAPGYWRRGGGRYVWVGGSWRPARSGYVYYGPRWTRVRGRWVYHDRYWGRDPHWHYDNGHHYGWDHDRGHDRDDGHDHGHDRDHGHGHGHGHDHD